MIQHRDLGDESEKSISEAIEQARRAQQENEQRHDVQLEISNSFLTNSSEAVTLDEAEGNLGKENT